MAIQYFEGYFAGVVCKQCGEIADPGEDSTSAIGAKISACEEAKAEGWNITDNHALCPNCDNAESAHEELGSPNRISER